MASVAEKLRVGWVDEYKSDADDFTMNLIHISLSAKDALLKTHASPDDRCRRLLLPGDLALNAGKADADADARWID